MSWEATDSLRFRLSYMQSRADQDGGTLLVTTDPPVTTSFPGDFNDVKYDIWAGTLEYDFGFAQLNSTFTGIDLKNDYAINLPFPPAPGGVIEFLAATQSDTISNETRLVSTGDSIFQWLVGVYYYDSDSTSAVSSNAQDIIPNSTTGITSESISFFGEASWALMDGTLIPLVGVRYFEDKRSVFSSNDASLAQEEKFTSTNPRFNLSWLPSDTSTYYLNIAKDFRSGVFNDPFFCLGLHAGIGGLPCELSIDSDSIWSYELGTKQVFADGQASLDIALYYQDWKDVRQAIPFFGLFQTYQFSDAEITGIDVTLSWSPASVEGLTFTANGNWNNSEYKNVDPTLGPVVGVQDGDPRPFTPDWTLALTANHTWQAFDNWWGQAMVGFSHLDAQLGQFGTDAEGDKRDLLRARFGFYNERMGIYVYGTNLLNENGAIYSQTPTGGLHTFTQDYPRQIGFEVTFDYN